MKFQSLRIVGLAALAWAAMGCATLRVNQEKVHAIKTVAIVGFVGVPDLKEGAESSNRGGNLFNAISDMKDTFSGDLDKRRVAQAETVYAALAKHLEADMGWKVLETSALGADPTYLGYLKENPNVDTLRATGLQRLPQVLRAEPALQALDPASRSALMQRLGVDALVIAKVHYVVGRTSGFAMGGIGKTTVYPKARLEFSVLDGSEKPVWQDRFAEGSPTEEGLDNVMGAKLNENESQVLVSAAESGFVTLVDRCHKAPSTP